MSVESDSRRAPTPIAEYAAGDDSDYGTDIDEASLSEILLTLESQPSDGVILTSIEQDPVTENVTSSVHAIRLPRPDGSDKGRPQPRASGRLPSVEIEYDPSNRVAFSRESFLVGISYVLSDADNADIQRLVASRETRPSALQEESSPVPENDQRSPLERFRKAPKKPLSVTDIVSPAWCEQQYLYSLSKYGRVRKTPAMKQGSKVHKALEEQVHTEVRIAVKTREDMFGLRLWNVIQGLRTLRATGLTRELEVWGVLEGQVVNGIIDEITTSCPDIEMLQKITNEAGPGKSGKKGEKSVDSLDANQKTLSEYFATSQGGNNALEDALRQPNLTQNVRPSFYVVDIKTRQSRTVPSQAAQLRPTQMQLMLYHSLLASLAANEIAAKTIFDRYNLDGNATFSDTFIAEMANLNITLYDHDSMPEILEHSRLVSLWSLMISDFRQTLPDLQSCLSPLLTAEFRTADSGTLLGRRSFAMDNDRLEDYVRDELQWWKGERATKGVEIEDAFKCRICEFSDNCTWRKEKIEEGTKKARLRKEGVGKKSEV